MKHTHTSEKSLPRRYSTLNGFTPVRGVGQDKTAPKRARIATPQPAPQKNMTRTRQMDTNISRSQKYSKKRSNKRQTVQINLWVRPQLKAEIERIAKLEGLSVSQTGGAALEEWVRQQLHIQHAVLLQPIIETTIRKEISRIITRLALLLVRVGFEAGQTRRIVTNILGRQPGVTQKILEHILDESSTTTSKNMLRNAPQITALIAQVKLWLEEEEKN